MKILKFLPVLILLSGSCNKDKNNAPDEPKNELFAKLQMHTWFTDSSVIINNFGDTVHQVQPVGENVSVKFGVKSYQMFTQYFNAPTDTLYSDSAEYLVPDKVILWNYGSSPGDATLDSLQINSVTDSRMVYTLSRKYAVGDRSIYTYYTHAQ